MRWYGEILSRIYIFLVIGHEDARTMVVVGIVGICQQRGDHKYMAKSEDEPIAHFLQTPLGYEDDHLDL